MIAGNYKSSTTGGTTYTSNADCGTGSCDLDYTEVVPLPEIQMPIKRKLTKQDKRQMFKIADQKHSRRPGK